MKFFFDNNLPPDLARGLNFLRNNFGEEVTHLKDKFEDESIADEDWLEALIEEGGWSVVSTDRFRKSPGERQAIRHPKLNVFLFSKTLHKKRLWEKTKVVIAQWENISKIASASTGGIYEVRLKGKITPC